MATKQLVAFGDTGGTVQADTANVPSAVVTRDTDGTTRGGPAVMTTITNAGTTTLTPGASTAAAGTTTTDAGVLPGNGSTVLLTSAADDTKGVRIASTDKVTGRLLFIANGVSNKILKIYGPSGAQINGAAADAAYSTASGKGAWLYCIDSTANTWAAIG